MKNFYQRILKRAVASADPPPELHSAKTLFYPFGKDNACFKIHGLEGDTSIFSAIRSSGTFEPHLMRVLRLLIKPRDVILDIGANIGALTCVFSYLAPKGKTFAFEASSTTSSFLSETISSNKLTNVTAIHTAIAETTGMELTLNVTEGFLGGSFISTIPQNDGRKEIVQTVTIDDWLKDNKIVNVDIMKMDIEGAEIFALTGARTLLAKRPPLLIIECNAIALYRFHKKHPGEMFHLLCEFYEYIYIVPDNENAQYIVRIESEEQLLLSLCFGRGCDDLICSNKPVDVVRNQNFEIYLAELRMLNEGREIILQPDWQIRFENTRYNASVGETIEIPLILANLSGQSWPKSPKNPVNLSYHIVNDRGDLQIFDGIRTPLELELENQKERPISAKVMAPDNPGSYRIEFSPVQEGMMWFDKVMLNTASVDLIVR